MAADSAPRTIPILMVLNVRAHAISWRSCLNRQLARVRPCQLRSRLGGPESSLRGDELQKQKTVAGAPASLSGQFVAKHGATPTPGRWKPHTCPPTRPNQRPPEPGLLFPSGRRRDWGFSTLPDRAMKKASAFASVFTVGFQGLGLLPPVLSTTYCAFLVNTEY